MRIPINVADLPTARAALSEAGTYVGEIIDVAFNGATDDGEVYGKGPDKNGGNYISVRLEIKSPEAFAGETLFDNYISLGRPVEPTDNATDRRRIHNQQVRLGQFCAAFKVRGQLDLEALTGKTGAFTVKNEEYEGQITSRVKQYVVS